MTGALPEDIVLITVTDDRYLTWRHCFNNCDWWQVPYLKTLFLLLWLMTGALPEDIVLINVDCWQVPYLKKVITVDWWQATYLKALLYSVDWWQESLFWSVDLPEDIVSVRRESPTRGHYLNQMMSLLALFAYDLVLHHPVLFLKRLRNGSEFYSQNLQGLWLLWFLVALTNKGVLAFHSLGPPVSFQYGWFR